METSGKIADARSAFVKLGESIDFLISATPTGEGRNVLTEANLYLMQSRNQFEAFVATLEPALENNYAKLR